MNDENYSTAFSHEYHPPAPVLPVQIARPGAVRTTAVMLALVDTGADGTFAPTSLIERLDIPILYMTNVRSHLGEQLHRVGVYKVDLILFGEIRLPNIDIVGDDWGTHIILGRNVLNKLRFDMDGPGQTITLQE